MTATYIASELKSDILAGDLKPGAELQQAIIAERFGVSRIPVRDALALLASENLIEVKPNRGAHVIELSREELLEIYELRILLECACVKEAARAATAEQIDTVDYEYQRSSLGAGRPGWQEGDWAFHKALYEPSGKKRHISLIEELRQTCLIHIAQYDSLTRSTEQWLDDHQALLEAFREKDGNKCAELVRSHLEAAMEMLLQSR